MCAKTKFLSLIFILFFTCPAFSKNIAIIPFQNITGDKEKNWVGAGFSETLTTKLVKVKEITVLEREQLSKILEEIKFQYTGAVDEKTAVEKGKMYGVDVFIFGSFQVVGEKLRVTARFVDVQTRKVIDTAEANGNISDIFKLQDKIAFDLMDSLKIVLGEKEKEEIRINPTENLTAYQWFSKGNEVYYLKLYDKAIEYYTKAIQITDPKELYIAAIYFWRGNAYYYRGLVDEAIEDFTKSIKIFNVFSDTYIMRGYTYCTKGLFDEAIEDFTKAIQLDPDNEETYNARGFAYGIKKLFDEAIKDHTKAIQINPKFADAYNKRGVAYYYKKGLNKLCISDWKKAADLGNETARQNLKKFFNIDY